MPSEREPMDTTIIKTRMQAIAVPAHRVCDLTQDLDTWIYLYVRYGYTPPLGNITLHINLN